MIKEVVKMPWLILLPATLTILENRIETMFKNDYLQYSFNDALSGIPFDILVKQTIISISILMFFYFMWKIKRGQHGYTS